MWYAKCDELTELQLTKLQISKSTVRIAKCFTVNTFKLCDILRGNNLQCYEKSVYFEISVFNCLKNIVSTNL